MKKFTLKDAALSLIILQLNIKRLKFSLIDLKNGMNVELEHGTKNKLTNITNDDMIITCKIALAHLFENPNYYKILIDSGL